MRQTAFFEHELGLSAVIVQHAIPHEPITHTNHNPDFINRFANGLGRSQRFKAGLFTSYDFEQAHDVGWAEEVGTNDFVRTFGNGSNCIDVKRRRV